MVQSGLRLIWLMRRVSLACYGRRPDLTWTCRLRLNGNMLVERERQVIITMEDRRRMTLVNLGVILTIELSARGGRMRILRLGYIYRTVGGFMTCMEMFVNGVLIGMGVSMPCQIQGEQNSAHVECCAVAVGTLMRTIVHRLVGFIIRRLMVLVFMVFVFQHHFMVIRKRLLRCRPHPCRSTRHL